MTREARVEAPAKINAFLHVGAREASGFHEILTLFVRLDLSDSLVVRTGGSSHSLDCGGEQMPAGGLGPIEKNLAYRAAAAFSDRAGWPNGFSIELTKRIPAGGGLGGGSSDAAAVLKALNAMCPNPISEAALMELGATLGSDVPFFVSGHPCALGTGRGEKLMPVDPLPERGVLLVIPPFGISTADAYQWLDEDRPKPPAWPDVSSIPRAALGSWEMLEQSKIAGNDFEPVVEQRHPVLRQLREGLTDIADGKTISHLSGSGSTVFALLPPTAHFLELRGEGFKHVWTHTSHRVVQVEVLQ